MPALKPKTVVFPIGGFDKRYGFQAQPPFTSAYCNNIWPIDPSTGRERGGSRPPLETITASQGAPYFWAPASFLETTAKEGILMVTANGLRTSVNAATWINRITTNPNTDFCSGVIYNGHVFMARSGGTTRVARPAGWRPDINGGASEGEADLTATKGTAPTNCGLVWVHEDRLAFAGCSTSPHQVFFSAVGDHLDYNYADKTIGGAWTNTGSLAGQIGHAVTAAINHDANTSLIGSPNSIYAVRGNPRLYGARRVNTSVGPLTQNCWCKGVGPQGEQHTYMFTKLGLYVIPESGALTPQALSRKKIPNELLSVNPGAGDRACIGYDGRWEMLHIAIDPFSGSNVHYSYHIPTDSWWPETYAATIHLFPTFPNLQTDDTSSILPIGNNGTIYQFDRSGSESFDSYLAYGPFRLGGENREGIIYSIAAALAKDSNPCNFKIYTGDSAEQAYTNMVANSAAFTGTEWSYSTTQYWNYTQSPLVRGAFAFLKVYDDTNQRFLIEEIIMEVDSDAGRRMVG